VVAVRAEQDQTEAALLVEMAATELLQQLQGHLLLMLAVVAAVSVIAELLEPAGLVVVALVYRQRAQQLLVPAIPVAVAAVPVAVVDFLQTKAATAVLELLF
jgi:hypothetical protein